MIDANRCRFRHNSRLARDFALRSKELTVRLHKEFHEKAMQDLDVYAYLVMSTCFFGMDHHPSCNPG